MSNNQRLPLTEREHLRNEKFKINWLFLQESAKLAPKNKLDLSQQITQNLTERHQNNINQFI